MTVPAGSEAIPPGKTTLPTGSEAIPAGKSLFKAGGEQRKNGSEARRGHSLSDGFGRQKSIRARILFPQLQSPRI